MKTILKSIPFIKKTFDKIQNLNLRREWVKTKLETLPDGAKLLDAGCGSQQFKEFCSHLEYRGQDFGQYIADSKKMIGSQDGGLGGKTGYKYGKLDYVGDIWSISEDENYFDAILCTEVFEHIPYPIETLVEFARLLRPGGKLFLTLPSNCLRHMDPYFYYSGFSDRWLTKFLLDNEFEIVQIEPVGDYYSWLAAEIYRTFRSHGFISKILLVPAFVYFITKRKTQSSIDTLCMGYHVVATKK